MATALVEECSLPAVTSNLCEAVAKIIKESHAFVIDGIKSFEGQGHKTDFLSAAISAAAPAASADLARYNSARVSMTVTSQAKHLPPSHGIRVTPSGRFPSDLTRPTGS